MDTSKLPKTHTAPILPQYLDVMGHMNIQWYTHLFELGAWNFFNLFDFGHEYIGLNGKGAFALEINTRFLTELKRGDTINIFGQALGRRTRTIHFMLYMVRASDGIIAATFEEICGNADLQTRKLIPFPEKISEKFDTLIASHKELDIDPSLLRY